jgi:hypothetical protein
MCWDIEKKKLESQRQVTNLKELLTHNALVQASLVTQSEHNVQFRPYRLGPNSKSKRILLSNSRLTLKLQP